MDRSANACIGDFGGDEKQEIIFYSRTDARIYAVSQINYDQPAPTPGKPLKQPKEYVLYSRYGSGDPFTLNDPVAVKNDTKMIYPIASYAGHRRLICQMSDFAEIQRQGVVEVYTLTGRKILNERINGNSRGLYGRKILADGVYMARIVKPLGIKKKKTK